MKDIDKLLVEGNTVEITRRLAWTPDRSYTKKGEYFEKSYCTKIVSVEDREDHYYVGHHPLDARNGQFGYFRVMKFEAKKFGIVNIKQA